jgi:hypothetical protein
VSLSLVGDESWHGATLRRADVLGSRPSISFARSSYSLRSSTGIRPLCVVSQCLWRRLVAARGGRPRPRIGRRSRHGCQARRAADWWLAQRQRRAARGTAARVLPWSSNSRISERHATIAFLAKRSSAGQHGGRLPGRRCASREWPSPVTKAEVSAALGRAIACSPERKRARAAPGEPA